MQDAEQMHPVDPMDMGDTRDGVTEDTKISDGGSEKALRVKLTSRTGSSTSATSSDRGIGPLRRSGKILRKFVSFLGPGFMISVCLPSHLVSTTV